MYGECIGPARLGCIGVYWGCIRGALGRLRFHLVGELGCTGGHALVCTGEVHRGCIRGAVGALGITLEVHCRILEVGGALGDASGVHWEGWRSTGSVH